MNNSSEHHEATKRRTNSTVSIAASATKRVRQSPSETPYIQNSQNSYRQNCSGTRYTSLKDNSCDHSWNDKLSTPGRVVSFFAHTTLVIFSFNVLFHFHEFRFVFNVINVSQASLRKHASRKGLGTPSPGGANAAITMLQLTNEERLRRDVLLGDVLKSFIAKFGACIKRLKVSDVVSMLRCTEVEIVNLSEILNLFGVARLDVSHQVLVWIGFDSINTSVEDIIQLSQASTTSSYKHLSARMVAFFVVQIHRSNCRRMWNLKQIIHCLNPKSVDAEITKRMRNIGSVFVGRFVRFLYACLIWDCRARSCPSEVSLP